MNSVPGQPRYPLGRNVCATSHSLPAAKRARLDVFNENVQLCIRVLSNT
jgi:hypothetical protein